MIVKTEDTFTVRIYMAGSIEDAKRVIRKAVYPPAPGLCVTIEPTTFIYTGGEESGFVVGLVNYPRFPTTPEKLFDRAQDLTHNLLSELCQLSALIVSPETTEWVSYKDTLAS